MTMHVDTDMLISALFSHFSEITHDQTLPPAACSCKITTNSASKARKLTENVTYNVDERTSNQMFSRRQTWRCSGSGQNRQFSIPWRRLLG